MRSLQLILLVLGWTLAASFEAAAQQPPALNPRARVAPFEFKEGDRVVFLGDTWVEREQSEGYIEAILTARQGGKKIIFRNLAWSADTVLGESRAGFDAPAKGFDRLKEQLEAIKPTVVFLGYGMASSFAGEAGIPQFKADLKKLISLIREISGADQVRFIIMTPIRHENLGAPLPDPAARNEILKKYADALNEIARDEKTRFFPLFETLTLMERSSREKPLTDNGIHPTPYGYWRIALLIERSLGHLAAPWRFGFGADGSVRGGSAGMVLDTASVVKTKEQLSWSAKDQFLVTPVAPAIAGKTNDSPACLIQFIDFTPGNYVLKVDGVPVAAHTDAEWKEGQYFQRGPHFDQVEKLRHAIRAKNELFFHRWRPQNNTYLFGFRSHEQGRNAKEIPMFDPLIEKAEAEIFELAKPKTRAYLLAKATPADLEMLERAAAPKKAEVPVSSAALASVDPQPVPEFIHDPSLEITLFAQNPDLAKPIHMNFDPEGRLWVASSETYPQIAPGSEANDKILVIEDLDGDGKADKSTVFASDLLIPTGVEFGNGGAYVANSTELLFMKDTDGDGVADEKRVLLSGFGTEDTHHILHSLRWGHDGQLYMNQSIYIHSHVETPRGVVRLNSGGIFNFRPDTMELGVHMKGLVNTWGHHFDRLGQSFATDGAGGQGIHWVIPQAMYFTYAGARRIMDSVSPGNYPKFCGLEVVESGHFPEDWRGTMVTCDFRANRVVRFGLNDLGSGYITKELPDLMRSINVTFRPIDVKVGPDGALYIADWSNPIIQHGEVDFRDPRRDHTHGRIWRVAHKGRPALPKPALRTASNSELLANLLSPNGHLRQQSRRVLAERGAEEIRGDLKTFTKEQSAGQGALEALWMWQSIDVPEPELLKRILADKDGGVRAAGVRVLSFWLNRVENPMEALATMAGDDHPRVRVEAIRALSKLPSARSAELVLGVLDKPMDKYLDYAVWLTINDLAEVWVKALQSGEWKLDGRENQLAFGLRAIEPRLAGQVLSSLLATATLAKDGSGPWIDLVRTAGTPAELALLLGKAADGYFDDSTAVKVLNAVNESARARNTRAENPDASVAKLMAHASGGVRAAALGAAGGLKLTGLGSTIRSLAADASSEVDVRKAAITALRDLGGAESEAALGELAGKDPALALKIAASKALAALSQPKGLEAAIAVMKGIDDEAAALDLWRSLLANRGAAEAIAQTLPREGLPGPVVSAGLRAAREGGRNEPNLVLALARHQGGAAEQPLAPEELKRLAQTSITQGDAARGELVYRRAELACVSCHAIGGVGGKVGPDMTSIGASAPVDYLLESLLLPNAKIKEGYHAVQIITKDELEFAGTLVRESSEQVVLRDASNKEVPIPVSNIESRRISNFSLMPAGLIDGLSPQDRSDLVKFLSELGKPGPFDASRGNVARLWKLMAVTLDLAQFPDVKNVATPLDHGDWVPQATLLDGRLARQALAASVKSREWRNPESIYAAARFDVPSAGKVTLNFEGADGAAVFVDGTLAGVGPAVSPELAAGRHVVVVKLAKQGFADFLRLKSDDATFVVD